MVKSRSIAPTRRCLKSTGPGLVSLMAIAMASMNGDAMTIATDVTRDRPSA